MVETNKNQSKESACVISDYRDIYKKLKKCIDIYLKVESTEKLKSFILKQRKENSDGIRNTLIELPDENIEEIIKKSYTKIDYLEGKVCSIDETDQYDGITNMTLLMLMSNRLSKHYKYKMENEELTPDNRKICHKNKIELLRWKDIATKDLIASLYVLNKTGDEYKDFFSYGYRQDKRGQDSFVIDLPFFGQICVHMGNKMQDIMIEAQESVKGILEKRLELGQISQQEVEEIIDELNEGTILPNYRGKLYEYTSALPIDYEGNKVKRVKEELGLKGKLPEDIDENDIKNIYESRLNSREQYYFGIKLGLPREQLEQIVNIEKKYLSTKIIGRSAVDSTTAEERQKVKNQERNIYENLQEGSIDK